MRRDLARTVLLVAAAVASGWVSWSGYALLLPAALTFPLLWSLAPNRSVAALISAGYFLAASRGLPLGVATFYASDLWPGLALWLVASTSFVAVHTALWSKKPACLPIRYLVVAILMAVPPFGITGWAHPVTAAGVLFPGWGWYGLAAMTAGLMGLVSRTGPAVAIALVCLWSLSAATWDEPHLADGWRGVDLEFGQSLGRDSSLQRQKELIALARDASSKDVDVIVLPESALGFWTPTVERLWTNAFGDTDATVIAGAAVIDADGYDNVLVAIGRAGGRVLYRERMPVPGSMWQPWQTWFAESGGARADVFANPVVDVGRTKIAPLICYEQLVVWPVLQSMLHSPDIVVAVGNGWWTSGGSFVAIQRSVAAGWARLFSIPLVISFNT